jgi:hypothetical protein
MPPAKSAAFICKRLRLAQGAGEAAHSVGARISASAAKLHEPEGGRPRQQPSDAHMPVIRQMPVFPWAKQVALTTKALCDEPDPIGGARALDSAAREGAVHEGE